MQKKHGSLNIAVPIASDSRDFSDASIAKGQRAGVVALQRDVSALGAAEIRIHRELAGLDFRFPIGAPELVLEQLETVQPVLDVRACGDNARCVPLAYWFQMS